MKAPKVPKPDLPLLAGQQEWIDQQVAAGHYDLNPCVRAYGPGPVGKVCRDCNLFYRKQQYSRTYYKCELRGDTNGPGTDHKALWAACAKFAPC